MQAAPGLILARSFECNSDNRLVVSLNTLSAEAGPVVTSERSLHQPSGIHVRVFSGRGKKQKEAPQKEPLTRKNLVKPACGPAMDYAEVPEPAATAASSCTRLARLMRAALPLSWRR